MDVRNRLLFSKLFIIIIFFAFIGSDLSAQYQFRNLGNYVNTGEDEFLPLIYNDTLYFRRSKSIKPRRGQLPSAYDIQRIALKDITYPAAIAPEVFNGAYPAARYSNPAKGIDPKASRISNVAMNPSPASFFKFSSDKLSYIESEKKMLGEINSNANDFHPAVSRDGSFIIFASDRPRKGNPPEGGIWDTDLYVTFKKNDNTWTKPKNLGKTINTKENELAPSIALDGTLYYSSKGFIRDSVQLFFSGQQRGSADSKSDIFMREEILNYNIVVADAIEGDPGKYENPRLLPYPINTEWNEIGAAHWKDTLIFFASDRPSTQYWGDQYGKYDLYGYCLEQCPACKDTCKPYILNGTVVLKEFENPGAGRIVVLDEETKDTAISAWINDNSTFRITLPYPYDRHFLVQCHHPCLKNAVLEQRIFAKCDRDNEIVKDIEFKVKNPCADTCDDVIVEGMIINNSNCYIKDRIEIMSEDYNYTTYADEDGHFRDTVPFAEKIEVLYYHVCYPSGVTETIYPECKSIDKNIYEVAFHIPETCICEAPCKQVIIAAQVTGRDFQNFPDARIDIFNSNMQKLSGMKIGPSGMNAKKVRQSPVYTVRLYHEGLPLGYKDKLLVHECDLEEIERLDVKFNLQSGPQSGNNIILPGDDSPLFVTGYYRPNTSRNLEILRNKFINEEYGSDRSTKHIEYPGIIYDEYALGIDLALETAAKRIANKMKDLEDNDNEELVVTLSGWADPRVIYRAARYDGDDETNDNPYISIKNGERIDNKRLSELRAYFTAKYIINELKNYNIYDKYEDRVKWKTIGKGIDPSSGLSLLEKRRVEINMSLQPIAVKGPVDKPAREIIEESPAERQMFNKLKKFGKKRRKSHSSRRASRNNSENAGIFNISEIIEENEGEDSYLSIDRREAFEAFTYLNKIRRNPNDFSSEIGADLSGIESRQTLNWNENLARVAEERAYDMAYRNYTSHVDPDGFGVNVKMNKGGYRLATYLLNDPSANNFESIAATSEYDKSGSQIINQLILDEGVPDLGHRKHLLGITDWDASLYDAGIGIVRAKDENNVYRTYACVIIAKHEI